MPSTAKSNSFSASFQGMLYAAVVLLLPYVLSAGPTEKHSDNEQTVLLFFHPAVGTRYISAIFSKRQMYLPLSELFSLFLIHHEKGSAGFSMQGKYAATGMEWSINPAGGNARLGKKKIPLTTNDYRIGEIDLYLTPEVYEKIFSLRFIVNLYAMSARLESDNRLPIEDRKHQERLRLALDRRSGEQADYPLLYPRDRKILSSGMLDYSLSGISSNQGQLYNYTFTGGLELLGGDIQGTISGVYSENHSQYSCNNLRWRYALKKNPYLTAFRAGQLNTTGLHFNRINGVAITNDPIMPRRTCDNFVIDGNTVPDSEVELYVNNMLVDYTATDELGYYRFDYSLNYGTASIKTRIYTPAGKIITEEKRIQVPYTFLPKKVFTYNLQGGLTDNNRFNETLTNDCVLHGDIAYGIANGLTAKLGADQSSRDMHPQYYGSLSARLFKQYLLNVVAAPGAFYTTSANATFPASRSISITYTEYDGSGFYNNRRAQREMSGNIYFPFLLSGLSSGIRLNADHLVQSAKNSITSYRAAFNTRIGRTALRLNYRDRHICIGNSSSGSGLFTAATTWHLAGIAPIPLLFRSTNLRMQASYDSHQHQFYESNLQVSRSLHPGSRQWKKAAGKGKIPAFQNGRLYFNIAYNFKNNRLRFQAGLTLDLQPLRLSTQYTNDGTIQSIRQTSSGSLALDTQNAKITAKSRNRTGQSAAAVKFFIDSNDDGIHNQGEMLINAPNAFRLKKTALPHMGNDTILRLNQLQSYWTYHAEIVQEALPNPTLAPVTRKFSFTTDPNRHKPVEIPLYRTGVIEGSVTLIQGNKKSAPGGVRLKLKSLDRDYKKTLRTFNNGSYYAMNLLPGEYKITIEPVQLDYLGVISKPEKRTFKIKALAEGDYLQKLNFKLIKEK